MMALNIFLWFFYQNAAGLKRLRHGIELILAHHERWDGTGYPFGLKAGKIPLSARIMALADVYDALTQKRSYKEALSHEQAKELILASRGRHFDPQVVDAFLEVETQFKMIAESLF